MLDVIALEHPDLVLPLIFDFLRDEEPVVLRDCISPTLIYVMRIHHDKTTSFINEAYQSANYGEKKFIRSLLQKHCYKFLDEHEKKTFGMGAEL